MTVRLRSASAVRRTHTPAEERQAWGWLAQAGSPVVVLAEAGDCVGIPRFNGLSSELIDALLAPERAAAWVDAAAHVRARRHSLGEGWEVSVYASAIRLQATGGEVVPDPLGISKHGHAVRGGQQAVVRSGDAPMSAAPGSRRRDWEGASCGVVGSIEILVTVWDIARAWDVLNRWVPEAAP